MAEAANALNGAAPDLENLEDAPLPSLAEAARAAAPALAAEAAAASGQTAPKAAVKAKIYVPDRRGLVAGLAAAGAVALGAGIALIDNGYAAWSGAATGGAIAVEAECALFAPAAYLTYALGAALLAGGPRLLVTRQGVKLDGIFGTRWAKWSSLGAFSARGSGAGPLRRSIVAAPILGAPILGKGVSETLRGRDVFAISSAYHPSPEALAGEINKRRAAFGAVSAPGAAPPVPQAQEQAQARTAPVGPGLALAALAAIFAIELFLPGGTISLNPTGQTLLAMGAPARGLVLQSGEWLRLASGPLLQASIFSLLFNGIALWLGGRTLEKLAGSLWFGAAFLLGMLGGALASLLSVPDQTMTVGASGGVMAAIAAAAILAQRAQGDAARGRMRLMLGLATAAALVPAYNDAGVTVDYAAHLGGAAVGAALGWFLLKTRDEAAGDLAAAAGSAAAPAGPRHRVLAAAICAIGCMLCATSFLPTGHRATQNNLIGAMFPQPVSNESARTALLIALQLDQQSPDDPNAQLLHAAILANLRDYKGADKVLDRIIGEAAAGNAQIDDASLARLRAIRVVMLFHDGKTAEAEASAPNLAAACADPAIGQLHALLVHIRACD